MKERLFQKLDYRDYTLEKMPEFALPAFSAWFAKCSLSLSHMNIADENFSISFGATDILYSSASRIDPLIRNRYQSCLYNSPLPVKAEFGPQKICANMGLHYQFRANIHNWINALVIEMAPLINMTIQESAQFGLSRKETSKAIEKKLLQMKTFSLLDDSTRAKVVQKIMLIMPLKK